MNVNCQIETDNPKYCSRSCSAGMSNLGKNRHGDRKFTKVYPECANSNCSNKVKNKNGKKYCSIACSAQSITQQILDRWIAGDYSVGNSKSGLSHTIRTYLIKQANFKCQSPTCCVPGGWGEINLKTGKSFLEIEHIDGNCHNNVPSNLIVLCPNCHSLTPTYKGLNKGHGRAYRGKYDQWSRVDNKAEV